MPQAQVVIMLSLMLGMQALTTDLYLPALPLLRSDLAASMPQVQLTLTALLICFGVSQLAWGPIADRWGRRPVLMAGLWSYTLSSLACMLAPSIDTLILWRGVQGVAMGAVVMCARAIVRDLYAPVEGARIMSKALTGLGFMVCISAPVGSLLAEFLGWRASLAGLALFGLCSAIFIHTRFRESLAHRRADATRLGPLVRTWAEILAQPTFRAYALLMMGAFGALFNFLSASSFVLIEVMQLSRLEYGLALLVFSVSYLSGTFLCRRLLMRFGQRHTVRIGALMSFSGGALMFAFNHWGEPSLAGLLLPFLLVMVAHGIHQPISQSGAVAPFPKAAGAASALSGFAMMVVAFAIGHWMGLHLDGTVYPLINGQLFWSLWLAVVGLTLVQRHGERHG
ncbi:MAG: multidrug effflux MFS transporter [Alphaproteobacteria bacterium]|nr:multidrug effflux MFS transporter [Alphaproteobacteria bacterium]